MPVIRNRLRIGSLTLGPGYKWHKIGHSKNYEVMEEDECVTEEQETDEEEYTFRVYCGGNCDLSHSYELKSRIDAQLRSAVENHGRIALLWQENMAELRRELIGGTAVEVMFELQRQPKQIVALDVNVKLRDSILLEPVGAADISGGEWSNLTTEEYRAVLVMEGSSVLTEGIPSFLGLYTTLAEFDGSGYSRALVRKRTVNGDIYQAADLVFPKLGEGTAPIASIVIIRVVNNDDDSEVVGVIPYTKWGGRTIIPTGGTVTFRVNLAGLFDITLLPANPILPPVAPPPPPPSDPPPDAPPEPEPPTGGATWTQIFFDDFTTPCAEGQFLSTYGANWEVYQDGWPDTAGNIEGAPSRYWPSKVLSVQDGMLIKRLHTETINGVQRPLVAAILPKISGVVHNQLYGRYEVRFKADSLAGYKTAWLLWPQSENWPRDGEIDFPEGGLDGGISAYMHHQGAAYGWQQDAYETATPFTAWHIAVIEWTSTSCKFILDGVTIGESTNTSLIPNTPMHWVLQTETCFTGCQPAPATQGYVYIDWVAMYALVP